MANKEHLDILRQGVDTWNGWRQNQQGSGPPDLSGAQLSNLDLWGVNLSGAILSNADFSFSNISKANLSGSRLIGTTLSQVDLSNSELINANLSSADLGGANLTNADLSSAKIVGARFYQSTFSGTKFFSSTAGGTSFGDVDLRGAEGLETVQHWTPSDIAVSTIYKSEGEVPRAFLIGCGIPDSFISHVQALVGSVQPIQFHSCFISYSTKDEEFAKRLHARMRQAELRVWFAPEDMKGGDHFSDQIDRAIQVHDRLLLVLSENSMASNWVIREIKRARKVEEREGRKKLFPISLTGYEALRGWECLDHDSGLDLAEEVRKFHIPNFTNWKDHDDFEREFKRLYASLKAEA